MIMNKLTRKFKELGGPLRLRAGVREIQADARRVVGVVLDDGETLPARNVLSSAGFYETMQLCQPRPADPEVGEAGNISFVETISVLDRQPAELDHTSTIVFYNDSDRFTYANPDQPVDLRSGIVCSPNNFQYPQPLAEGVIRLTALANHAHWLNLPEPDYTAQKERWSAEMIQAALRFIPDFRSHIVDTDVFTPRTIRKFTGHVNGCVYGAPQKHLMGTTHLENLFICGTDQGYLGIIGAMLSGITVANLHLLKSS